MRIKITSDSTCDLSPEIIEENDITIVPLGIVKNNESFIDGININPADIFAHVDGGGSLCSTAAVNIAEYYEIFSRFAADYDAVIHVNIGAEFSSCYQNACLAAKEFSNVYVIDSKNLSSGQGHIVIEACLRSRSYEDIEALCADLRDLTDRVETSFVIDRLDYMVKGGRCSSVTALGANLLKLKPCIEVKNGKMQVAKKYRGAYTKCLEQYVKDRLEGRDDIIYDRIFITYPTATQEELDLVHEGITRYGHFDQVIETHAGCTVSCHCGPKTLGILFIRKS